MLLVLSRPLSRVQASAYEALHMQGAVIIAYYSVAHLMFTPYTNCDTGGSFLTTLWLFNFKME